MHDFKESNFKRAAFICFLVFFNSYPAGVNKWSLQFVLRVHTYMAKRIMALSELDLQDSGIALGCTLA